MTLPYPNEHAARLQDPKKYGRFRRKNDQFGPGIDAIFGVTSKGKVELQAIRFDAKRHTAAEARAWLKAHNFTPILFEPAAKPEEAKSMATPSETPVPALGDIIRLAAGAGSAEILAALPVEGMTDE